MKKYNYQQILEQTLNDIKSSGGAKPSLLLHACCGPCSSYVIEYLASFFDITVLYYNPNIYPQEEYQRRLEELKNLLPRFLPAVQNKVKLIEDNYDPKDFYEACGVKGKPELAKEAEKGERCHRCYKLRMKRAYEYAVENKFDYFTTTLSISPFKDAEKINEIGMQLESGGGTKFLFSDFKKKDGFKRSLEISEEFGLYRQHYCGCIYSKNNVQSERNEPPCPETKLEADRKSH